MCSFLTRLLPALCCLTIFCWSSCKKDETVCTSCNWFTCEETDGVPYDDGQYEQWTHKERDALAPFLHSYQPNSGAAAPNAPTAISLSHKQANYHDSLYLSFRHSDSVKLETAFCYLQDGEIKMLMGCGYYALGATGTERLLVFGHPGADTLGEIGCNRLYYVFTDRADRELTKGHFDVKITR